MEVHINLTAPFQQNEAFSSLLSINYYAAKVSTPNPSQKYDFQHFLRKNRAIQFFFFISTFFLHKKEMIRVL